MELIFVHTTVIHRKEKENASNLAFISKQNMNASKLPTIKNVSNLVLIFLKAH